jgi:hypothetical protein
MKTKPREVKETIAPWQSTLREQATKPGAVETFHFNCEQANPDA